MSIQNISTSFPQATAKILGRGSVSQRRKNVQTVEDSEAKMKIPVPVLRPRGPSRPRIVAGLGAIGGALLFAWTIRAAGLGAVLGGVRRLGTGFIVVLLFGGVRQFVRTVAWRSCLESPDRLSLGSAFLAFVAGDSLGNVTPFGVLISEPSKILLTRRHVSPSATIAALTVENLLYSASVVVLLLSGTAVLLLWFTVTPPLRIASLGVLAGTLALTAAGLWVLGTRRRVASRLCALAIRHNIVRRYLEPRFEHVEDVEDQVFSFADRHPNKILAVLGLEVVYHATAVAEIWVALSMITGAPASILTAFALEYVNRSITTVFQFVPMWLGVDEAGTGLVTAALQLGPATGVSLALARKGRNLIWTAAGIGLLVHEGFSVGQFYSFAGVHPVRIRD